MEFSRAFVVVASIFLCFLLVFFCSRFQDHEYHEEHEHLHTFSRISLPPSPAPEAASPSYNGYSSIYTAVFNVRSFGAVGDGVTDDTQAFKMAWDTACQAESATLLVPSGHSFMIQSTIFTGPCKTDLIFQVFDQCCSRRRQLIGSELGFFLFSLDDEKIEGTIMAPDGPSSWPRGNSRRQWLVFYRINEMSMQGGGVIDGRGEKWWDLPCKPHKVSHRSSLPCLCYFRSFSLTSYANETGNQWKDAAWSL